MNAFEQEVGSDKGLLVTERQDSGIITDDLESGLVFQRKILGEPVDQTELTKL